MSEPTTDSDSIAQMAEQAADSDAVKAATGPREWPTTKQTDDHTCHRCGTPLNANLGVAAGSWSLRSGICVDCRYGNQTDVDVGPYGPTAGRQRTKMAQKRSSPNAQSSYSAAMFLDDVPAGHYTVVRTTAFSVAVIMPDDVDAVAVERLAKRYQTATKNSGTQAWYVWIDNAKPVIYLVDRLNVAQSDLDDELRAAADAV